MFHSLASFAVKFKELFRNSQWKCLFLAQTFLTMNLHFG
jgi:hypothetical protein